MERFSGMAKWNHYFVWLDDKYNKYKERYKVKINKIQWYDPYQIKKEELSGNISKFLPVQWQSIIVNYFLFSLSPLTKEELKMYKVLESYNKFAWGWVKEVKIKRSLNYLLKLPWLLDGSAHNVFPSLFYCLILIRYIVFIALAKISERKESMGNCQLSITSVSPIYVVDEFNFLFPLFLLLRPTQQRAGWHNLVCMCMCVCVCVCVCVCLCACGVFLDV